MRSNYSLNPDPFRPSASTGRLARTLITCPHVGQRGLARARIARYTAEGDIATACDILNEVIDHGDDEQKKAARQILAEIA